MPFEVYTEMELSYMTLEEMEAYSRKLGTIHKSIDYSVKHPEAKFWTRMADLRKFREDEEKKKKSKKKSKKEEEEEVEEEEEEEEEEKKPFKKKGKKPRTD
jgi:predicted transcriptional regulator